MHVGKVYGDRLALHGKRISGEIVLLIPLNMHFTCRPCSSTITENRSIRLNHAVTFDDTMVVIWQYFNLIFNYLWYHFCCLFYYFFFLRILTSSMASSWSNERRSRRMMWLGASSQRWIIYKIKEKCMFIMNAVSLMLTHSIFIRIHLVG